jgi:hypothetical protein
MHTVINLKMSPWAKALNKEKGTLPAMVDPKEVYDLGRQILKEQFRYSIESVDRPTLEVLANHGVLRAGNLALRIYPGALDDGYADMTKGRDFGEGLEPYTHVVADGGRTEKGSKFYWFLTGSNPDCPAP